MGLVSMAERLIVFGEGPNAGAWKSVETKASRLSSVPSTEYFFCGPISNLQRSGSGVERWSESSYVGEYSDNERSGQGALCLPDGGSYVGGFLRGKFHGNGVLCSSGVRITGTWEDGRPHGQCKIESADCTFEGELSHGKRCGFGIAIYSNGSQYEGEWRDGRREGRGILRSPSAVIEGLWHADALVSDPQGSDGPAGDPHSQGSETSVSPSSPPRLCAVPEDVASPPSPPQALPSHPTPPASPP